MPAREETEPARNRLESLIIDRISKSGPILFSEFMDLALYHPSEGYYCKSLNQVGIGGDFITSVSTGGLFGALLCEQFLEWDHSLGLKKGQTRYWVEAGAHDGQLARDILDHCQTAEKLIYDDLIYLIIEPSEGRKKAQEQKLAPHHSRVQWRTSLDSLEETSIDGLIFSNELLDAMPVDRISWDSETASWFPWFVTVSDSTLAWGKQSGPFSEEIAQFSESVPAAIRPYLPNGFTTELGSAASEWWATAAKKLNRGHLLGIDYGLWKDEMFAPHRHEGTLRAYSNHRQNTDLLQNPGQQDLTAHVNFSSIERSGHRAGLKTEKFQSQESFLMSQIKTLMTSKPQSPLLGAERLRPLQALVHPGHFGRSFSVLTQTRI